MRISDKEFEIDDQERVVINFTTSSESSYWYDPDWLYWSINRLGKNKVFLKGIINQNIGDIHRFLYLLKNGFTKPGYTIWCTSKLSKEEMMDSPREKTIVPYIDYIVNN